jgi:uncharacterized Zn finger protein
MSRRRHNRFGWPAYVPVAERRRRAAKKVASLRKSGREIDPIQIIGRKIAKTFWGGAWCNNLEVYSDYANRLPRGRSYVRHGAVLDLHIDGGTVRALVNGSSLYTVELHIEPLATKRWKAIRSHCAGQIDSLIELLQGHLSDAVMEIVSRKGEGLFPAPEEIALACSCPDWATMCKHVAAVLYGVGARLDDRPELLFELRGVDPAEMVAEAVDRAPVARKGGRRRVLADDDVAAVFGVDIEMGDESEPELPRPPSRKVKKGASPKGAAKKTRAAPRKKATSAKRAPSTRKKVASTKGAAPATKKAPSRKRASRSRKKGSTAKGAAKKGTSR